MLKHIAIHYWGPSIYHIGWLGDVKQEDRTGRKNYGMCRKLHQFICKGWKVFSRMINLEVGGQLWHKLHNES